VLKDELASARERLNNLEHTNIVQSKENYNLNLELDYESIKNTHI